MKEFVLNQIGAGSHRLVYHDVINNENILLPAEREEIVRLIRLLQRHVGEEPNEEVRER